MKLRHILVPVDLSETSRQALDYAVEIGAKFEARIVLLYAIDLSQLITASQAYATLPPAVVEEQRRAARATLAAFAERAKKRGLRARVLVEEGSPYGVIVDAARRLKADVIIMTTHGRTGVKRALMGSVAETVLRHAPCPVLTVRPAPRKPRPPRKPRVSRKK
jgi:universal stress protein A